MDPGGSERFTSSNNLRTPPPSQSKLVRTPTREFAQQKLLGQTEDNMEAHVGPEVSEYKSSPAIRTWVVGIGKRS